MSNINAETYARWWKKLKGSKFIKKNPNLLKGGGSRIHPNTGRKQIKEHEEKADKAKKAKLRIASHTDTEGARRAKAMAKARIKSGKTIAQAEAERDKKMKKRLQDRHASWKKARKEGKLKEWEKKNKPKKKRRIGVDPNLY